MTYWRGEVVKSAREAEFLSEKVARSMNLLLFCGFPKISFGNFLSARQDQSHLEYQQCSLGRVGGDRLSVNQYGWMLARRLILTLTRRL
jgi:hypothetical protein